MPKGNKHKEKILLIRTSAMGDVAMLYPMLCDVLAAYGDRVELHLLTNPLFSPIFEDLRVRIIPFEKQEHGSPVGLARLFSRLRSQGFDRVLDLHNVLRSRILATAFAALGTKVYVLDKGRDERKALLSAEWEKAKPIKSMLERHEEVFSRAGYVLDGEAVRDRAYRWHRVQSRVIGIAPFAKHPEKQYPLEKMEAVLGRILDTLPDYRIQLYGAPGKEAEILEGWERRWPYRVANLAGHKSFAQQLARMKDLRLMLAMDSANGHLAANYRIPVVTVWGTTHPYMGFKPYLQPMERQVIPEPGRYPLLPVSVFGPTKNEEYRSAIASIPPEHIVSAIKRTIGET